MTKNTSPKMKVSDQVFLKMKEMIGAQSWKIGERIPPESQLMEMFDVSRISVREALRQLVCLGMLQSRQGSGTYVVSYHEKPFTQPIASILSHEDLIELLEVRRGLEIESAALAARRAEKTEIEILKNLCDEMSAENITLESNSRLDLQFHMTLAQASKNKYIIELMSSLSDPLAQYFNTTSFLNFSRGNGLNRHRHIYEAVKAHNIEEARFIMGIHFDETMEIINRGYQEITQKELMS